MPTIRLATNEVQVDDLIYTFGSPDHADAFEACVATVDIAHCEINHVPLGKRPVGQVAKIMFTQEATLAKDGSVQFQALVDGKAIPCQISRSALEQHFGAIGSVNPLDAYSQGREKIHAHAEHKLRRAPSEPVHIAPEELVS
jgi:hypothetical protein